MTIPASGPASLALRSLKWAAFASVIYVAGMFVAANVGVPRQVMSVINVPPYAWVWVQQEVFAEADTTHGLDVLFVGSSHAQYTFDPAFFDRLGLRTFNLGSPSQSPVSSVPLIQRYVPRMTPRVLVLEAAPFMLAHEDAEGTGELAQAAHLDGPMWQAILASRSVVVWNGVLVHVLRLPQSRVANLLPAGFKYRGRGFASIRRGHEKEVGTHFTPQVFPFRPEEARALESILSYAAARGIKVYLPVQPIPPATKARILNYAELSDSMQAIARRHHVTFVDFNETVVLPDSLYYDDNHLRLEGAETFLPILYADMKRRGLLDGLGRNGVGQPVK